MTTGTEVRNEPWILGPSSWSGRFTPIGELRPILEKHGLAVRERSDGMLEVTNHEAWVERTEPWDETRGIVWQVYANPMTGIQLRFPRPATPTEINHNNHARGVIVERI